LVCELGVHSPGLREVRGLRGPHGRCAQAHEHSGRHQRVEPRIELGTDVRYVAQHGQAKGPLDGEPLDEERRHEYAAEHQGRVDGGQGHGAQALAGVDRTLQVGRALERGELHHERQADGGHVLQDPPLLFGRHFELSLGLVVVAVAVGHDVAERRLGQVPVAGLHQVVALEALVLVAADHGYRVHGHVGRLLAILALFVAASRVFRRLAVVEQAAVHAEALAAVGGRHHVGPVAVDAVNRCGCSCRCRCDRRSKRRPVDEINGQKSVSNDYNNIAMTILYNNNDIVYLNNC